ncbi:MULTISPECIES: hypothetical protein [Streptomyces]|uniref:hypothetical protein n=1 Tax=Streptomyces TaxID=1883 RepID=UPI0004AB6EEA|nr:MULTISPECIES: hypothetical protein [Streptomyces]KOG42286.1 hypothetical protein ADK74_16980 [Streptomyces decoyicus]QZY13919.1 hypothetical protein K7C20_00435 [Streptomyces decoyicus]WSV51434.1 hypothetical protein OG532_39490 [Streptomyces decoyicus]BDH12759.1 hypothetical protein HOK021_39380 [Streptomyces hygroscopicus]
MDESRQSSSGAGAVLRRMAPPPALCGFLLLLALMFAVSYAVGAAAGPVAPGMHGTETSRGGLDDGGAGSGTDTGGMGGMHGGGG